MGLSRGSRRGQKVGLRVMKKDSRPINSVIKYSDTSRRKEVDNSLKILDSSIADLRL